jgi:hypothetical protein
MRKSVYMSVGFAVLAISFQACSGNSAAQTDTLANMGEASSVTAQSDLTVLTPAQVKQHLDVSNIQMFDANGDDTRQELGILPGAVLLASYDNYPITETLPKNKEANLSFYCYNTQ